MTLPRFSLTGHFVANDIPCAGDVHAVPSYEIVDYDDDTISVGPWVATLDVNGKFALLLPAIDGLFYTLNPMLTGVSSPPIVVPSGVPGQVLDLSEVAVFDIVPIPPLPGFQLQTQINGLDTRVTSIEAGGTTVGLQVQINGLDARVDVIEVAMAGGGGGSGISTVDLDTDGVPYFNPAGIPGSAYDLATDTDGVPYITGG